MTKQMYKYPIITTSVHNSDVLYHISLHADNVHSSHMFTYILILITLQQSTITDIIKLW